MEEYVFIAGYKCRLKIPELYSELIFKHLRLFQCSDDTGCDAEFSVAASTQVAKDHCDFEHIQITEHGENCFTVSEYRFALMISLDTRTANLTVVRETSEVSAIIFSGFKWFLMYLAIWDGGLPVHSSLIGGREEGVLFCGQSGKGKSTIHALLSADDASIRGSDEVNIVFLKENKLTVYPTPVRSSGNIARFSHGVTVRDIFFIEHSPDHRIESLDRRKAAHYLLKNIFHYPGPGMLSERMMDTALLFSSLNVYSVLWFKNDSSIAAFLKQREEEVAHADTP